MTLAVFFDTNAFHRKDVATDLEISKVASYLKSNNIGLYTNRVVLTELANQRERDVKYISLFYEAWCGVFRRNASISMQDFEIRSFSKDDDVLKPMLEHGVVILENHADDIHLGVEAMYRGLKPTKKLGDDANVKRVKGEIDHDPYHPAYLNYNYKESSIKDFFIWRSLLSIVQSRDVELVFISSNYKDFCDGENEFLHPELASQYASSEYGNIIRVHSLKRFIEDHINFVEGFEVRAGDIMREMEGSIRPLRHDDRYLVLDRVEQVVIKEVSGMSKFKALIEVIFSSYEENDAGEPILESMEEITEKIEVEVHKSDEVDRAYGYYISNAVFSENV